MRALGSVGSRWVKVSRLCSGLAVVLAGLVLAPLSADEAAAAAPGRGDVELRVLSNRADLVSGGDALVRVVVPPGADASTLTVDVDGRDVTDRFAVRADGRHLGLVTGLDVGVNRLTARLPDRRGAYLDITNHPIGGPVFSGPQIQPWTCAEGAIDEQCNRPPIYEFFYMPEGGGGFRPYDPDNPPSDVAETTTDEGHTVPYIVRQETGVIVRDEYRIAVLFDPDQTWQPWSPQEAWNHKLLITHGASCDTSYEQGSAPDVLNDTALSRGFAVMSHALDNSGHNCNVVTQAESLIMTKEYLVDHYGGPIRYSIGTGCSGGALAQYQIANAYPGVYQGITPACSFPDHWTGRMLYEDYSLLRRYFENPTRWEPGVVWTERDIAAVWGHPNHVNAITYNTAIAPLMDPSRSCPGVPEEDVYHPENNPDGVRCSSQDYMVNVFGRRAPASWTPVEQQLGRGFANRPWDTTGVQYGLRALQAGVITPAQFADLNLRVGGRDIDYEWQPERTLADRPALARAYRSGAANTASNLDQVAIIDLRGPDPGAFHDVYRTYALRARLEREHGHADNMVLWRGFVPLVGDVNFASQAILAMDEWLAAIEADPRAVPLEQKIVEDKPDSVDHRCTDGAGHDLGSADACDAVVESYSTARIEAGMPFTDDVIKCQLKPLRRSDYYPNFFTEAQWAKLKTAFPTGVCDYTRSGVDYELTVPWLTYEDGPDARPLGNPPASTPFASRGREPRRLPS